MCFLRPLENRFFRSLGVGLAVVSESFGSMVLVSGLANLGFGFSTPLFFIGS